MEVRSGRRLTFPRNPLTEDQENSETFLLVPGLVRAAERNFNRGSEQRCHLRNWRRVFKVATQEESVSLAVLVSGERQAKSWNQGRGGL